MHLTIHRLHFTAYGIGGQLHINGQHTCDTLEHPDHLIPEGTYTILIRHNQTLSRKVPYLIPENAHPRKKNKNTPHLTTGNGPFGKQGRRGNILIGQLAMLESTMLGLIIHSSDTFTKLLDRLNKAQKRGQNLTLTIQ